MREKQRRYIIIYSLLRSELKKGEFMKVKIIQPIINFEGKQLFQAVVKRDEIGKPIRNEKGEPLTEDQPTIWRTVAYNALEGRATEREVLTAEDKVKCGQIERKIYESNEPDLTETERTFLIERIEKTILSPMICVLAKDFFGDKKEKIEEKRIA